MGGRTREILVTLRRDSPSRSWGFSLVGGADANAPLIVTKVRAEGLGAVHYTACITSLMWSKNDISAKDVQFLFLKYRLKMMLSTPPPLNR